MPDLTVPTGPRGTWLMGHLPAFSKDRLGFLRQVAREYGDIVMLRFANLPVLFVNHPDYLEDVLVRNHRKFIKSRALRRAKPLLGEGLLTSEGDFWRRQRRLSQPAFHMRRIEAYSEVMVRFAEEAADRWHDGETRDLHTDMMHVTLQIVAKTLFDHEVSGVADKVGSALTTALHEWVKRVDSPPVLDFLPTLPNSPWARAIRQLDEIVYDIINQRRASGIDQGDLLSMLLQARDDDGSSMTDKQLRDEVMTLFLAGHETTANALSWTWYLLSQHPEVDAKLAAELETILEGRAPTLADLPRLTYTEMVITETMRLYPPAWVIVREATEEFELAGCRFRAGTNVMMSQYTMHRHPRYFEEPDRFLPERWENGLAKRLPTYAYFPFGGGPRICIGKQFAMMEAVLVLATIARRYRAKLAPGHSVEPEPMVTLRPKHRLQMVLRKR